MQNIRQNLSKQKKLWYNNDQGSYEEETTMKKVIFGSALMISGMIGCVGWLIAEMSIVQRGAWSDALSVLGTPSGFLMLFFFIVSIAGMVIAISGLKGDK